MTQVAVTGRAQDAARAAGAVIMVERAGLDHAYPAETDRTAAMLELEQPGVLIGRDAVRAGHVGQPGAALALAAANETAGPAVSVLTRCASLVIGVLAGVLTAH